MKTLVTSSAIVVLGLMSACSKATFSGTAPKKATSTPTTNVAVDPAPTTETPAEPGSSNNGGVPTAPEVTTETPNVTPAVTGTCAATEKRIGAQIALIIDNSNSNSSTDCPSATVRGDYNGTKLYTCGSATNREAAVLATYDTLRNFGQDGAAHSELAVASFPKSGEMFGGWTNQSNGWIVVNDTNRDAAKSAMQFSREPFGMTPYTDAVAAATELFSGVDSGERAKVAILVTDGEPTDRDPNAVKAKAEALRAQGVKVIVITYNETQATRIATHTAMMETIDNKWVQGGQGHWFTSAYASFTDYIGALVGEKGLMKALSSNGSIIEAGNSQQLKDAILSVVRSEALACAR